ncbi:MAG: hypothetical protein WCW27_06270 [Patescibacteria group bacterium]|jgi:hypothetical protein
MFWLRQQLDKIRRWYQQLSYVQQRILLVSVLLIGAVFIGWLIYFIFFKPIFQTSTTNDNTAVVSNGQLPDINLDNNPVLINTNNVNGGLPIIDAVARGKETLSAVVYNGETQSPTLNNTGLVSFYNAADGKFYRVDANGNVIPISEQVFKGVNEVAWSNDNNKAVLQFEDGNKLMYDFTNKKQYTLNKDIQEVDFSANDTQIGFKYMVANTNDRWLGVSNPDGSQVQGIEPLGDNADKVIVDWSPSGKMIGTFQEYVDNINQKVIPVGLKGENYKAFVVNGRGLQTKWSPSGDTMLYATYSTATNYNYTLGVAKVEGDTVGTSKTTLGLNTTVDKCAYNSSGTTLYCAVPTQQPTGAAIAPEKLDTVPHEIYRINLAAGTTEKIAIPADNVKGTSLNGINNVLVDANEKTLYYQEAVTKQLRKINLK